MRNALKGQNSVLGDESGQALLEYIFMILVAISTVAIIHSGFRTGLKGLWSFYSSEIIAACPGCPVDAKYRVVR